MNNPEENSVSPAQSFEILLFKVADFLFGVPAEQISRILNEKKTRQGTFSPAPINLGKLFHLPGETAVDSSCLLEVNTGTGSQFYRVDMAEGLRSLGLPQIRRLPPLIESKKANPSFWGLGLLGDRIACLVDLDNLETGLE